MKPSQRALEEFNKLRLDVAAAEVITKLNEAGIRSILLKGPSIASWLYEDWETRTYFDVDLLVSAAAFPHAEELLLGLGFRHLNLEATRIERDSHHESWFRELDGVCIELHRGIIGIGVSDQAFWNGVSDDVEPLQLGVQDGPAQVLAPPARALLVALHVAQHGPTGKPRVDAERALARVPIETWREAAALAHRLDAERAFALGLSLVSGGQKLVSDLGLHLDLPVEELIRGISPPRTAGSWEQLARKRGLKAKLVYAFRKLAPSRDLMIVTDALARRGRLGLVAAYLRRPFRLARLAPRGFRAWRSLRRRGIW